MEDMTNEKNEAAGQGVSHAIRNGIFEVGHSPHELVPAADGPMPIEGRLRKAPLRVPDNYEECSGFTLFGRRIRTLLYSTDVAAIRNSNADAIFAVYPFTAQPAITQALLTVAEAPLFVGVGGGTTTGRRAAELAAVSEMQGAAGVVLNSPATPEMVAQVASTVDIPVIATITRFDNEAAEKISCGARIINVASVAAFIPQPDLTLYSSAKRFMLDFTRALDAELGPVDIHATAVCPKYMRTEFFNEPGDVRAMQQMSIVGYERVTDVARSALASARAGKSLCIPSIDMKALYALTRVLPYKAVIAAERALGVI